MEASAVKTKFPFHESLIEKPKLVVCKNLDDDSGTFASFWRTVTSSNCRHSAFLGLRITLFTALPLMLIAHYYRNDFPMYGVLALLGVAHSQDTVGEQLGFSIMAVQVGVWCMVWGSFLSLFDIPNNEALWWSLAFLGCFVVGLTGDLRCRRAAVLFTIIIMEVQRESTSWTPLSAVLVGRDIILSGAFATLQAFIPPFGMNKRVDEGLGKVCTSMAEIVRNSAKVCWSKDPLEAMLAASKLSSDPLQDIFIALPGQMFHVMYEMCVTTLQLELRRERLRVLQGAMPMVHGLTAVARALNVDGAINVRRCGNGVGGNEVTSIDTALNRLNAAVDVYCDALENALRELSLVFNPRSVSERVSFDNLAAATSHLQSALDKLHYDTMVRNFVPRDTVWYMNIVFAHHMMILLGEELLKYAHDMKDFDHRRYKSAGRRILEFLFLDAFLGLGNTIKSRLTFATPHDVRVVKNAFKIACAYTLGCAYSLYLDKENVYYFGMTILMGVGLPTAGESIMRVADCRTRIFHIARLRCRNSRREPLTENFLCACWSRRRPVRSCCTSLYQLRNPLCIDSPILHLCCGR
uniref:Uncharacterized protein n=1 Tax=Trypanosoma congolense (strain IL3000) TaxID=1068625 RepID=G0UPB0_TRYCI|nr:conserved hypothetical protein [Trypanosoma congolense IL3000]